MTTKNGHQIFGARKRTTQDSPGSTTELDLMGASRRTERERTRKARGKTGKRKDGKEGNVEEKTACSMHVECSEVPHNINTCQHLQYVHVQC